MQINRGKQQNGKNQISPQKIRAIKGLFHAKIGTIKDRKGKDLIEGEDIKKSGKNRKANYRKDFKTQITMMV